MEEIENKIRDLIEKNEIKLIEIHSESSQPEEIINNIRDNLEKNEIISRQMHNKSKLK